MIVEAIADLAVADGNAGGAGVPIEEVFSRTKPRGRKPQMANRFLFVTGHAAPVVVFERFGSGYTPGMLTLFEKHRPDAEIMLWPRPS